MKEAQKWRKLYNSADDIPDNELPRSFDLRNINGYDFTGPIRDQGRCGSCYTQAFVQAVESRLKLKYGRESPKISAQQAMQCNFMNEGCGGGWPHLNGYFFEHAHLVSETCAPYKAKTKGFKCADHRGCESVAKIAKTKFIGGGWGKVNEKHIMKELIRNGALSIEFQATKLFGVYKEGILSEGGLKNFAHLSW